MTTAATVSATSIKPVQVFRDRRLSVGVFRNVATVHGQERTFHSLSIQRTYQEGEAYQTTHSLDKDDLPVVQLLLAQAWEWIVKAEAALRKNAAA